MQKEDKKEQSRHVDGSVEFQTHHPGRAFAAVIGFERGESAVLGIPAEDDELVRSFTGGDDEGIAGREAEGAGRFLGRCLAERGEGAVFRVYGENGEAVVAAIGGIDEAAVGADVDVGTCSFIRTASGPTSSTNRAKA
jgi:hypothetical protein